ncbi:leucine-rich repeat flightless-interacting protein 2 isoform X3 [Genypterus blacodes]|uniref:leucine-rich repeat flightless-interacting protein 2 isoform X3 n=1 Tax=Genypterus blacodes TaxID=154954 RepID=UPI003F768936
MGTQGAGRRRSSNKERSTAEDDALNLIAREAEARLAAKRAARAEAREIRMKELERQQKEIFQVQKKYYGLNTTVEDRADTKWGDIEQWMEDSERYSRPSRTTTLSDDDERMSVGSRGSVRSDLDQLSVGTYGGASPSSRSHKKSKKKKKHKHKDRDSNGYDDDNSVTSCRVSTVSRAYVCDLCLSDSQSSRLSDDSRVSRSSRLDLQPASYGASDLYSLNGASASRNQGSTFNGYQSSLYEDSVCSASDGVSPPQPLEYSSYRTSGSRVSSRAGSARASPVDNSSSVASFLRSAANSSNLPRDLDDVTIPDFSDVEDRDYVEKGSRAASALTATTLTSLGGSSSRRGSGDTAITLDPETSTREIKEIHELKDQIQDVESKYTQNLKEVKDTLTEVEEKYRKAMVSNAQLDNEKSNLMYQVDTLKDSLMELEELLSESRRDYDEKLKECDREKHAHTVLQFQFSDMKETLKQSEELLNDIRQLRMKQDGFVREIADLQETVEWKDKKIGALERQKEYTDAIRIERDELREEVVNLKDILKKHGIVLGPDLSINGEIVEAEGEGSSSGDPAARTAQVSQTSPTEGNSMLEIRLRKLVDEREKMIEQVKKLKAQLEQKTQRNSTESNSSPDGEVLENGTDPNMPETQRDANRQMSELKFKLVKAEQEVNALEQNVTRLEGQVTRYKSAAENAEKVEDELKAEKRKLQRELRSALDKSDELESNNSHLSKRLEKMKSSRGMAQTP